MKKLILTLLLCIIMPAHAFATEAYEFTKVAIGSFAVIKDATSNVVVQKADGREMFSDLMKNAVKQTRAFGMADVQIKDFENSDDTEIKQAVALLSASFTMLKISSEQSATVCEKILNDPRKVITENGSITKRLFELQEQSNADWDVYVKTSGVVTMALTDSNRTVDGKLHYIKITKAEREQLKKQIVSAFGVAVKKGFTDKTYNNTIPAILLWKFLNDNWAAADSQ